MRMGVAPVLGVAVIGYFAYHLVHGDRGLVAWRALSERIGEVETDARQVTAERQELERRVALLRPDSLDRDMLDERVREVLNLAHPDDLVILRPQAPPPR
ncbi:cell division protein FtsB [Stella humosa]|uniref:Cell division protein FtsB n=2 Tax=Stella humosa TaxID=94 RepID=A0A3N1MFV8_9PROT|nr:septum formation initiator family protein [Stella humosa]ROQ01560.1 cell division protein FtsB [Stella humosa]BBK31940.1 cell division protein [Stella humosa]